MHREKNNGVEEERRRTLIGLLFAWSAGEKNEGQNVVWAEGWGPSVGVFIEGWQSGGERKECWESVKGNMGGKRSVEWGGDGGGARQSTLKLSRRTESRPKRINKSKKSVWRWDRSDASQNEIDRNDRKQGTETVQQICRVSKLDGAMRGEMTRLSERRRPKLKEHNRNKPRVNSEPECVSSGSAFLCETRKVCVCVS